MMDLFKTRLASVRRGGVLLLSLWLGAAFAGAAEFWDHWGDGRAELSGYRLIQPRYGADRAGHAVLIFVTEDFSDSSRVKADPGRHPERDVYPVLKLNAVRKFQTGIYDYSVLTSTFTRLAAGLPVTKISFSSQEWCGHVYHQLLPFPHGIESVSHSYFDGEADAARRLPARADGVYEDALPILLRGLLGPYLAPGESRRVPFLPSLWRVRAGHEPLAWTTATISSAAAEQTVVVPAGRFRTRGFRVAIDGGATLEFQLDAAYPHRLVRWTTNAGEQAMLLRSTRLAYWKLNAPGGERYLAELGLPAMRATKRPLVQRP